MLGEAAIDLHHRVMDEGDAGVVLVLKVAQDRGVENKPNHDLIRLGTRPRKGDMIVESKVTANPDQGSAKGLAHPRVYGARQR